MPRKTVTTDEVSMRKHGAHVWTDNARGQTFWCFCDTKKDHTSNPRWA